MTITDVKTPEFSLTLITTFIEAFSLPVIGMPGQIELHSLHSCTTDPDCTFISNTKGLDNKGTQMSHESEL